ncbi:MAG TPA: hypothetical protein DCX54_02180 [Flavobacteriales bacterium]|nr:hypothetical protein [Flavobacteriales bacterium]
MLQNVGTFKDKITIICDELNLAKKWGKASLILTVHKSVRSQEKTKKTLQNKLDRLGFHTIECDISKLEGNFVEKMLLTENTEDAVFYISNVSWGGGEDEKDGYRVLNLYRETLIEQKMKAVFFLTLREASHLPGYAPDFWAFRHRVFEFRSPRSNDLQPPPVGLMLWHLQRANNSDDEIDSKISSIMQMLTDLPDRVESASTRIDLQYELGYLYWQSGNDRSAGHALRIGLDLAKKHNFNDSKVKFLNALSILSYEQKEYEQALELLAIAIESNPKECLLLANQAVVMFAMGKRYQAIQKGKRVTTLCTDNPWLWNSLGFLHFFAGNMDEAITCFQKSIELSPITSYFIESLAICYLTIGLSDKATVSLCQAQSNVKDREIFKHVLKESIEGESENVSRLVKEAIDVGKLAKLDTVRDPNLNAILSLAK